MRYMNSAKALSIIYQVILKNEGPASAREYVAMVLSNIVDDLHIEGLPVTPENIELRLCERAEIYKDLLGQEVA